jgi:hypothetical protein
LEVRPGLALAKCHRLWPDAVGSGLATAGYCQVRSDLARHGRPCNVALVHPSMVHLSIVIPIFVYLQVIIPTQLVELY